MRNAQLINAGAAQLAAVLNRVFQQQARSVAAMLSLDGEPPDLTPWIAATANAVKPVLIAMTRAGVIESQRRIAARLGVSDDRNEFRRYNVGNQLAFKGVMCSGGTKGTGKFTSTSGFSVTKAAAPTVRFDFNLFDSRILDSVDAAAFAFCRETMETARNDLGTALDELRQGLRQGLSQGEATRWLSRKVGEIFASPQRAFRIAVTETSRAVNGGQFLSARAAGTQRKEWVLSPDACELCHQMLERGEVPIDEPFWVDPKGGVYATVMYPPAHPHCVLPNTLITCSGILHAFRAFFTGTCYRVSFTNGDEFTCTPNHMLLTPNGFSAASTLMNGDYVLCCNHSKWVGPTDPYNYGQPTSIEQVFNTLCVSSGLPTSSVMPIPEYLHGDAAFCKGNIDIVRANRFLRRNVNENVHSGQPINEQLLIRANAGIGFNGDSTSDLGRLFFRLASLSTVRSARHHLSIFNRHSLKRLSMPSMLNTIPFKDFKNGPACALIDLAESCCSHSSNVTLNDLLLNGDAKLVRCHSVTPFQYSGYVYDIETTSSLYGISNGLVSSNCMCAWSEVL